MKLPRFSLRLLLVAVAVLCVCLAWIANERQFVKERRSVLNKFERRWYNRPDVLVREEGKKYNYPALLPPIRRILGDQQIVAIVFLEPLTAEEHIRYRRLFPESQFVLNDVGPQFIWGPGWYRDDPRSPLHGSGP